MEKVFIGIDISKLTLDVFVKGGSKTHRTDGILTADYSKYISESKY